MFRIYLYDGLRSPVTTLPSFQEAVEFIALALAPSNRADRAQTITVVYNDRKVGQFRRYADGVEITRSVTDIAEQLTGMMCQWSQSPASKPRGQRGHARKNAMLAVFEKFAPMIRDDYRLQLEAEVWEAVK